jgi:virulence factor Mce-like protein
MTAHRHAALGLALLLALMGGVFGILSAFGGDYSSYDVVYADVPASGTGISAGSVVIFRDITVGEVGQVGRELPDGLLRVELHITPDDLAQIPDGVTADVEIATVFGTQGINLVPPASPSRGHLAADHTITSVTQSKTSTLQGDATDLDNVLDALHPAALDATLTAIATALKDQGPELGTTISQVATYLNEMLPQLPAIENDLRLLGPGGQQPGWCDAQHHFNHRQRDSHRADDQSGRAATASAVRWCSADGGQSGRLAQCHRPFLRGPGGQCRTTPGRCSRQSELCGADAERLRSVGQSVFHRRGTGPVPFVLGLT